MAEAFARHYGGDLIDACSAGMAPAPIIQPETFAVMAEKGIVVPDRLPVSLYETDIRSLDRIVNLSGWPLPGPLRRLAVDWPVDDPMGKNIKAYRRCRDEIEPLVRRLVEEMRERV
jgi:protein-tyrosine-phosphatase